VGAHVARAAPQHSVATRHRPPGSDLTLSCLVFSTVSPRDVAERAVAVADHRPHTRLGSTTSLPRYALKRSILEPIYCFRTAKLLKWIEWHHILIQLLLV
jgi:hypothetical protein